MFYQSAAGSPTATLVRLQTNQQYCSLVKFLCFYDVVFTGYTYLSKE